MEIYSDFSFVQKISYIFSQGGLSLSFTRPLFVLSILTTQIFLGDSLMQFLLAQILNNWCAISSLAILCDDADALCTWKAVSELRAKSSFNAIRTLYKNMYVDDPTLCIYIKRTMGVRL